MLHENALVFSLSEARNFFMYINRYDLTRVISKSMNAAQNCSIDLFSTESIAAMSRGECFTTAGL